MQGCRQKRVKNGVMGDRVNWAVLVAYLFGEIYY